ncbi:MAG: biopolymer transporter ExbD [Gemmatimonadales bacterium]
MSMSVGGGGGVQSEPNVTPMIDVLLVLLIIFMVVQAMSRVTLNVQVPPPNTPATSHTTPDQIVMELRDDGSYAINGQLVPKEQLAAQIHSIFDPRPQKLMFFKPGLNREYQDVIEAMDIALSSGVEIVGFTPAATVSAATP